MAELETIEVVAGLLFEDGRLLAAQRRADGAFPLQWEFPGGKIEPLETPEMALVRELGEELGIDCEWVKEVFTHTHRYDDFFVVKLRFFRVPSYRGKIVNRVFEQIRWISKEQLAELDFLDGDRPVIEWLISDSASALWHTGKICRHSGLPVR